MRTFSLQRTFEAVLVDDAISYMASRTDLRAALGTAWMHLSPGGVMVVGPDDTRETFIQNHTVVTPAAGKRESVNVEVVFVENSYDPNPDDDHYEGTMVYMIREDGRLRVEMDHHILGLFALEVWRETLAEVGFRVHEEMYVEHGKEYITFVCLKPT
jgi:hypothetical protein